jgi:hypothetical protein
LLVTGCLLAMRRCRWAFVSKRNSGPITLSPFFVVVCGRAAAPYNSELRTKLLRTGFLPHLYPYFPTAPFLPPSLPRFPPWLVV